MLQKITSLSAVYQKAAKLAIDTSKNAYAAYSEFHVGAAFVHPDGSLTPGCNYENCTFQATCAERCAMVAANALGKRAAVAVAIFGETGKTDHPKAPGDTITPPCGLCRQHLWEVAELSGSGDLDLILVACDKQRAKVVKLSSLLPYAFGPSHVPGMDLSKYRPVPAKSVAAAAASSSSSAASSKKKAKAALKSGKSATKKKKSK